MKFLKGFLVMDNEDKLERLRLASLGRVASSVAHDLNNLLAGVLGHVSVLRLSLGKEEAHRDSLTAIEDAAKKAAKLVQQIVEYARGAEAVFKSVNISSLINSTVEIFKPILNSNINLKISLFKDPCYVLGDESQLFQLLFNLFVNARDSIAANGEISVITSRVQIEESLKCINSVLEPGSYIRLQVLDSGRGIPAELMKKIFEPFFTTKGFKGTGLGLATVLSVVESHKGGLCCLSKINEGTSFEVYLPEYHSKEAHENLSNHSKTDNEESRRRENIASFKQILIVDDEESVRTVIKTCLEHLGYNVVSFASGHEAIIYYKENANKVLLVITDMIMPEMNGEQLVVALKKINEAVKVIVSTGYANDEKINRILKSGNARLLKKPFAIEELAQKVNEALE